MELVINPAILVLDEPTSGLDSYTALQLMNTLKQVRAQQATAVDLDPHATASGCTLPFIPLYSTAHSVPFQLPATSY